MVAVAQRLERLVVAQEVGGSNPLSYPMWVRQRRCVGAGCNPVAHALRGFESLHPHVNGLDRAMALYATLHIKGFCHLHPDGWHLYKLIDNGYVDKGLCKHDHSYAADLGLGCDWTPPKAKGTGVD